MVVQEMCKGLGQFNGKPVKTTCPDKRGTEFEVLVTKIVTVGSDSLGAMLLVKVTKPLAAAITTPENTHD